MNKTERQQDGWAHVSPLLDESSHREVASFGLAQHPLWCLMICVLNIHSYPFGSGDR